MIIHDHFSEPARRLFDVLSVTALLGAVSNMLPSVATLLTVIWMAIKIAETDTVRGWFGKPPKPGKSDD